MNSNKLPSGKNSLAHMSGIALIEAMLALGVVMAAVVGVLWFNATILGSSAGNRVNSSAMLAAQAKLEELRNTPYDHPTAFTGNDIVIFESPGFVGSSTISVNRCWVAENLQHSGVVVPDIRRVIVSAVGGGVTCDTADTDAPVRLASLLAKSDPRMAAQNSITNKTADGKGRLVSTYTPPGTADAERPTTPSGFTIITEGGKVLAVMSPAGGPALVSDDGTSLKFATINGNIMFDGARTVAEFAKLLVRIEGHAMCRVYFPGYNPATPTATAPPTVSDGGSNAMAYVQYSCVVADGWRRSIAVLTGNTDEKVCVGYPAMQPKDETVDLLESPGRQYVGRKAGAQAKEWVWEGVRGASVSDGDGAAVIGSVCAAGEPCAGSTEPNSPRGWVPGGHHYFVMKKSAGLCADRIEVLGKAIDDAKASQNLTDTQLKASLFTNYFFRNPHKVYCTNDKAYTNSLPAIPANDEFTTSDCYSYTKVSGFINPATGIVIDGNQIAFGSNSSFYTPCRAMGAYGNFGGGYVCGFPESVTTTVTPLLGGHTFSPGSYSGLSPLHTPLDFVRKSFALGSSGGTCAAGTKTWEVNGTTCGGPITQAENGEVRDVVSTATGVTGQAKYACVGSNWASSPTTSSCSSSGSGGGTNPDVAVCDPSFTVEGTRSGNNNTVYFVYGGKPPIACQKLGAGAKSSTYKCTLEKLPIGTSYELVERDKDNKKINEKIGLSVQAGQCVVTGKNFL